MAKTKKKHNEAASVLRVFDALKEGGAPRRNVEGVIDFEGTKEVDAVPIYPESDVIDFEGTTEVDAVPVKKRKKKKKLPNPEEVLIPENIAGTY